MIIGVCGFGSSGSSAVTDYLKEFSNTEVLDEVEFQLLTYPDGVESLDYYLNQNISKYASSDVAITRFKLFADRIALSMNRYTNGMFSILTKEYIEKITQTSWRGYGSSDNAIFNGIIYKNIGNRLMKARLIPLYEKIFKKKADCYPVRDIPFSVKPENFEAITRGYLNKVLLSMGMSKGQDTITVLNQPFAGNDPEKSFKFFDDAYAIVVDRDPRDMYLFAKKFLFSVGRAIPSDDVETFVIYYKKLREDQPYSKPNKRILNIQFEEMVYDYENATKKIRDFCGLNLINRKQTIFVPNRSVNNTRLFEKYQGFDSDIKYIEKELSDYLFDYDKYPRIEAKGGMFYGRSELNKGGK